MKCEQPHKKSFENTCDQLGIAASLLTKFLKFYVMLTSHKTDYVKLMQFQGISYNKNDSLVRIWFHVLPSHCFDNYKGVTFSACGPLGLEVTSMAARWPSFRLFRPLP
ncbi:hypothetical protein MKLM6_4394 (plasmid) [Methylomonas koyamae]|nr:hypothetical protein MKLM6_4394 [Methylomonas koyamae]